MIGLMRMPVALVAVIGGLLALAACGSERAGSGNDDPAAEPPPGMVPDDYTGRFRARSITVLSSPEHGPQLCSYVEESLPPQCEGPDIVGWDWNAVKHQSRAGTAWGTYEVVGTFDDEVFTLTEPPAAPSPPPADEPNPVSPCPEPTGGWKVPDPSKATPDDMERAISTAHDVEGHAGGWIGWLIPDDEISEATSNDPDNYVINVRTSGDLGAMESAVREVWGGNLCVAHGEHTARELNHIASEVADTPGMVSVGTDDVQGKVEIGVWVATESVWRELIGEYGEDVIDLDGILEPID